MSATATEHIETPGEGGVEVLFLDWFDTLGWETHDHGSRQT